MFLVDILLSGRAYIDPSTGGMLFQILAVAFAAFSGFLLFFSRQIKMGIARLRRAMRGEKPDESVSQASASQSEDEKKG